MVKKTAALALALLLVILVAAALALLHRFDSRRLGELVLERVRDATGARVEATEFELRIFDGLVGKEVEISFEDEHRSARLSIDRLVLEHRLAELLRGTVAVDRVYVERPTLELREWAGAQRAPGGERPEGGPPRTLPPTPPPANERPAAGRLNLEVREVEVTGGVVQLETIEAGETSRTSIEDLGLRLRDLTWDPGAGAGLRALAAAGELDARSIVVGTSTLTEGRTSLAARDGLLVFENVRAETRSGPLQGRAEIDLRQTPLRYSFAVDAPDFALGPLMLGDESSLGAAALALDATGSGTDPLDAVGEGRLEIADGELPAAPVLLALDALLGKQVLVGAPYSLTPVVFRVEDGLVRVPGIELATGSARLGARGSVSFASELDLDLNLATPRSGISLDGVGGDILDLLTADDGWVTLSISISGTVAEPSVRLDRDALGEQAKRGAKRSLERLLDDGIRRLFDRDRKP